MSTDSTPGRGRSFSRWHEVISGKAGDPGEGRMGQHLYEEAAYLSSITAPFFIHSHFQGDSVSLTRLVLFPRAYRHAWSSWERGPLREAGEHGTSGHTRPQRRDWAQRQEDGVWWVKEGDGRGDMGSPGGDQGTCTEPGKAWNLRAWSPWPGPHPQLSHTG